MNKILYCDMNGNPVYTASYSNDADIPACPAIYRQCSIDPQEDDRKIIESYWLDGEGALQYRGPRPSDHHTWISGSWVVLPEALGSAKELRKSEVNDVRLAKSLSPILFEGVLFDADELSQKLIEGLAKRIERGAGLTAPWLGWKVTDNSMVWASMSPAEVYGKLRLLTTALEDRYNALLVASWAVKSQIDALTTIEAVKAFKIELES